jgi:hypothetical protein
MPYSVVENISREPATSIFKVEGQAACENDGTDIAKCGKGNVPQRSP